MGDRETTMGTVRRVPLMQYDIPEDLHQRAKAAAALSGRSLKQFVLDALEREVDRFEDERKAGEQSRS
jgi:hypothetical protein